MEVILLQYYIPIKDIKYYHMITNLEINTNHRELRLIIRNCGRVIFIERVGVSLNIKEVLVILL